MLSLVVFCLCVLGATAPAAPCHGICVWSTPYSVHSNGCYRVLQVTLPTFHGHHGFPSHPMPPTPWPGLTSTYPVQLHIARTILLPAFPALQPMEALQATRRPLRDRRRGKDRVLSMDQSFSIPVPSQK